MPRRMSWLVINIIFSPKPTDFISTILKAKICINKTFFNAWDSTSIDFRYVDLIKMIMRHSL